MAYRATITLRDRDYETLDRLKKELGMPTSQTIGLALQLAELMRKKQQENKKIVIKDNNHEESIYVLGLSGGE